MTPGGIRTGSHQDSESIRRNKNDAGHFAFDTKADQLAALIGQFKETQK